MSVKCEIVIGEAAMLKIGRNEVPVKVIKAMAGGRGFMVKSIASGKEFVVPSSRIPTPTISAESVRPIPEEVAPTPGPEIAPAKKMSLMDAAVAVLRESGKPMNTREMVKAATEKGYWTPTACRTPEQTLYGSIFREIKTKARPRIVRSETKGKFIAG